MPENHSGAEAAKVGSEIGGGDPSDADGTVRGVQHREGKEKPFHTAAAKVLMKMMYAARMARPDILRAISFLARCLTKWDEDCSKRLHRLMSYVDSTVTYRMYAWNDAPRAKLDLVLKVYSDADFAGCVDTQRSTTGAVAFPSNPNYSAPFSLCPKDRCVFPNLPQRPRLLPWTRR